MGTGMISSTTFLGLCSIFATLIGWIVSHQLSIRAQERLFHRQLVNAARLEIVRDLRAFQDWLTPIQTFLLMLDMEFWKEANGHPVDWFKHRGDLLRRTQSKGQLSWRLTLEDHDLLFPEVVEATKQIAERQLVLFEALVHFMRFFATPQDRASHLSDAHRRVLLDVIGDQSALADDLRRHVQWKALGEITDLEYQPRTPQVAALPRLSEVRGKRMVTNARGEALEDLRSLLVREGLLPAPTRDEPPAA